MKYKLSQKHEKTEKAILALVSEIGISKGHCLRKFNLPINYFNKYHGTTENYNRGYALFAESVMKSTIKNLDHSDANRKFIIQKTKILDGEVKLPKITDNKSARRALGIAIQSFAEGNISDSHLQSIKSACSTYSELSIAVDLQDKIERLEKLFEEKSNG